MKWCVQNPRSVIAATAFASGMVGAAFAETSIETATGEMDAQFAVASELYGDDEVQLHSRRESDGGGVHTIYSFDCGDQTYETLYEGDIAPEVFPVEPAGSEKIPLTKENDVVPLAQHACEQHGHPLLELRW